jgi:hypothetical protein
MSLRSAPRETHKEDNKTGRKDEGPNVVEMLDPVHLAIDIRFVLLLERGWEVEQSPTQEGGTIHG